MSLVLFYFIVLIVSGEVASLFLRRAYRDELAEKYAHDLQKIPESDVLRRHTLLMASYRTTWLVNFKLSDIPWEPRTKGFTSCIFISIIFAAILSIIYHRIQFYFPVHILVSILSVWSLYRLTMLISDRMANKIVIPDHPKRLANAARARIAMSRGVLAISVIAGIIIASV
jgi:hypothetical protein